MMLSKIFKSLVILAFLASLIVIVLGIIGGTLLASSRGWSVVLLLAYILLLLAFLVFACVNVVRLKTRGYRILLATLLTISLLCSAGMFFVLASRDIGWDPGHLFWVAEEHVEGNFLGGYWGERYFSRYENNIFIGLVTIMLAKIAYIIQVDVHILAIAINALLMFLASLLIIYAANTLLGRRGVIVAWFFSLVLIVLSAWVGTFYTDTLGLFFVSLVIALILKLSQTRNYIISSLLGVSSAIGFLIKPTVIIIVLAIIISVAAAVLVKKIKPSYRDAGLLATAVLLFFTTVFGFSVLSDRKIANDAELIEKVGLSADHFLAMGSLRGLPPYTACSSGGYCNELIADLNNRDDLANRDARRRLHTELLKNSVLTDFPTGYFSFAMGKVVRSFNDGSFLVWGEGVAEPKFFFNQPAIKDIRTYFYGNNMDRTRFIWQVFWLGLLILIIVVIVVNLFGQKNRRSKVSWIILGFTITIAGIALYQILFESRARYLFLYLPMFILLASYGLTYIADVYKNRASSRKRTTEIVQP